MSWTEFNESSDSLYVQLISSDKCSSDSSSLGLSPVDVEAKETGGKGTKRSYHTHSHSIIDSNS